VERFDLAVIGAGAAGLFCAGIAGQRGLKVVLLDHAARLGEKIRISGGGRCNFTNLNGADHQRYLSDDPRFARHALLAYPPQRFIDLVRSHRIGFHEKHLGQLFCDGSSQQIIDLLRAECSSGRVSLRHPVQIRKLERQAADAHRFAILTDQGSIAARNLVVATGGLSIPAIGATEFAWVLAQEWGLRTAPARPGLVPLTFSAAQWRPFVELAGVSLPVGITVAQPSTAVRQRPGARTRNAAAARRRETAFTEDLLFTHRGLSGPAILQISSYWRPGRRLAIDLLPALDMQQRLIGLKEGTQSVEGGEGHRQQLSTVLGGVLPRRLAQVWIEAARPEGLDGVTGQERLAEVSHARLRALAQALNGWQVEPAGSEGYKKAEVTLGGIATGELDPRSLQALRIPGLFFIGEAVDVTGWLGGYNFQWAWSSAHVAAMAIEG
jgi:predicted Rossmann fold flavoprotein